MEEIPRNTRLDLTSYVSLSPVEEFENSLIEDVRISTPGRSAGIFLPISRDDR